MNRVGKSVLVFSMMWVLLVMIGSQIFDNVTGKGLPPKPVALATAIPTPAPDEGVQQLADLQACVAADPKNLKCVLDLANLYYSAHQWAQAQVNYRQAVELSPNDPAVMLKLAGTYIYQNKFNEAIPVLRTAASIRPESPEIHLLLGLSLSKATPVQSGEALTEWNRVLTLAPGSAWAQQAGQYISETRR